MNEYGINTDKERALIRAIHQIGGGQVKAAALKLDLANSTVSSWLTRGKKAPAEQCRALERASEGQTTRYELRPDVYGEDPNQTIPHLPLSAEDKVIAYATHTLGGISPDRVVAQIQRIFNINARDAQAAYKRIEQTGLYNHNY